MKKISKNISKQEVDVQSALTSELSENAVKYPHPDGLNSGLTSNKQKKLLQKRKKEDEEQVLEQHQYVAQPSYADVLGTIELAQLDAAAVAGASGGAGAGAAGAAGAAAGASASVAAASSAAVMTATVTTATVTTAAVATTSVSTVGAAVGGLAAAAGGGGGGGGSSGAGPINPTPPAPYTPPFTLSDPPSAPPPITSPQDDAGPTDGSPLNGRNTDPNRNTLNFSAAGDPAFELRRLSSTLENLAQRPGNSLNKSLVIDLESTPNSDGYRAYYYTQKNPQQSNEYTTIGYYKNFSNVTGTNVADMITGDANANRLDGGAGNDIIYGAGGDDTLIGDRGTDWVLFKPLTRSGTAEGDYSGLVANLQTNTFSYTDHEGSSSNMTGFENLVGSDNSDEIIGSDFANTLVGANGDDSIDAGGGDDIVYGGRSGACGNQVSGGLGADIFYVGYDLDPVKISQGLSLASYQTVVPGSDIIYDWDSTSDKLVVSTQGHAYILGYDDSDDVINLRDRVNNAGDISVGADGGGNTITLSAGKDHVYVGYTFGTSEICLTDVDLDADEVLAFDRILDWDNYANPATGVRDSLHISTQGFAVLQSVLSPNSATGYTWSGNDQLDLRVPELTNLGALIVDAGGGSTNLDYDTIWGSDGVDYLTGGYSGAYDARTSSKTGDVLWGGVGDDHFYVGYTYDDASNAYDSTALTLETNIQNAFLGNDANNGISTSVIMDWKAGDDYLNVSNAGVAIIGGLDRTDYLPTDWSIGNTVDLSSEKVQNDGTIVVRAGSGNDRVIGSDGDDYVYVGKAGSGGYDSLDISQGGQDRIYIDSRQTKVVIDGFSEGDKIYIDRQMIEDFRLSSGISSFRSLDNLSLEQANLRLSNLSADYVNDAQATRPQEYWNGTERSFLGLPVSTTHYIYDGAYGVIDITDKFDGEPFIYGDLDLGDIEDRDWYSNGAYTNSAHLFAEDIAEATLFGAHVATATIATALYLIPFVGWIIATPFAVSSYFYRDDHDNHTQAHLNPLFNYDLSTSYVNALSTGLNSEDRGSGKAVIGDPNLAVNFNYSFTDLFYANMGDGYKPSVEFAIDDGESFYLPGPLDNAGYGVGSIVTVTDGEDTLIYMIASPDRMIQDNEAILLGRVNGHQLRSSDIVLYEDEDDIYQISEDTPISFPPDLEVTSFVRPSGSDISGVETTDNPATNDVVETNWDDPSTPTRIFNLAGNETDSFDVTVQFTGPLLSGDVVYLIASDREGNPLNGPLEFIYDGDDFGVDSGVVDLLNNRYTFKDLTLDELPGVETFVSYSVKVVRDGIEKVSNTTNFILGINGVSINAYGGVDADTDNANVIFNFPTAATVNVVSATNTNLSIENISATGPTEPQDDGSDIAARTLTFNGSDTPGLYVMKVTPDGGREYVLEQQPLYLGGVSSDDYSVSDANLDVSHYMFGFAGDDTITGGNADDRIYGGAGDDALYGGDGNDVLVGGRGFDELKGEEGDDIFFFDTLAPGASLTTTSDDVFDTIVDFDNELQGDKIQLDGEVFSNIAASTSPGNPSVKQVGSTEFVNLNRLPNNLGETDADINLLINEALGIVGQESANLFYDSLTGKLYYDQDSTVGEDVGDAGYLSFVHIATFANHSTLPLTLSHSDFTVI